MCRCQTPSPQKRCLKQIAKLISFSIGGEPQTQVELLPMLLCGNCHGMLPIRSRKQLPQPTTFLSSFHGNLQTIQRDGNGHGRRCFNTTFGLLIEGKLKRSWNHKLRPAMLTLESLNKVRNGIGLATAGASMRM